MLLRTPPDAAVLLCGLFHTQVQHLSMSLPDTALPCPEVIAAGVCMLLLTDASCNSSSESQRISASLGARKWLPVYPPSNCWGPSRSLEMMAEPRDCSKPLIKGDSAADGSMWSWMTLRLHALVAGISNPARLADQVGGQGSTMPLHIPKPQNSTQGLQVTRSSLLQGMFSSIWSPKQARCLCLNMQELPSYNAWESRLLQVTWLACPKHKWCRKFTTSCQQWQMA